MDRWQICNVLDRVEVVGDYVVDGHGSDLTWIEIGHIKRELEAGLWSRVEANTVIEPQIRQQAI